MSDQGNAQYFAGRAREERAMSSRATDPRAAAAHLEMAERYEQLTAEFGIEPVRLQIA
jgi:hypothetical protein